MFAPVFRKQFLALPPAGLTFSITDHSLLENGLLENRLRENSE
jgi:hypothetical protein